MRRYRAEIVLLLCTLLLCFLAVRALSQEAKPDLPKVTALKPGDEVKPLELESAKLGKLKAQIARDEAQETLLQQQFSNLEIEKRALQSNLDALVKEISTRIRKETGGVEIIYDPRTGEDGTFHVNTVPAPPTAAAKAHEPSR
jgi:hypothetical protein